MAKTKKKKPDITKIFSKMKNHAQVTPINNSVFAGFDIAWTMKDIGFGHLAFGFYKGKMMLQSNVECMSEKSIEKIIKMATPELAKLLVSLDEKPLGDASSSCDELSDRESK